MNPVAVNLLQLNFPLSLFTKQILRIIFPEILTTVRFLEKSRFFSVTRDQQNRPGSGLGNQVIKCYASLVAIKENNSFYRQRTWLLQKPGYFMVGLQLCIKFADVTLCKFTIKLFMSGCLTVLCGDVYQRISFRLFTE